MSQGDFENISRVNDNNRKLDLRIGWHYAKSPRISHTPGWARVASRC